MKLSLINRDSYFISAYRNLAFQHVGKQEHMYYRYMTSQYSEHAPNHKTYSSEKEKGKDFNTIYVYN